MRKGIKAIERKKTIAKKTESEAAQNRTSDGNKVLENRKEIGVSSKADQLGIANSNFNSKSASPVTSYVLHTVISFLEWIFWWLQAVLWNPNLDRHRSVINAGIWFQATNYGQSKSIELDAEDAKKNLEYAFNGVVRLEDRINTTLVLCLALLGALLTAIKGDRVPQLSENAEFALLMLAAVILLWRRRGVDKPFLTLFPSAIEVDIEEKHYPEYLARCNYLNTIKLLAVQRVLNCTLNASYVCVLLAIYLFGLHIYQ